MRIRRFLGEEHAVSPVIGIILMVAITVILATVIGTFALGLGDDTPDDPPNVVWDYDYPDRSSGYGGTGNSVVIRHGGGDSVQTDIGIKVDGQDVDSTAGLQYASGSPPSIPVEISDEIEVQENGAATIEPGDEVLVIYAPDQPAIRAIIGESEVP